MVRIKEVKNKVCYIEIDRPKQMNSLDKITIQELINFFKTSSDSLDFNVIVLSGSNNFFSAGADLKWMQQAVEQSYQENYEDAQLFNQLYQEMSLYPKQIIVKVKRGAYGGAIGLMACADVVITSSDANFRFSETALGLVPATVAPYILKKIGHSNANFLLISAHQFNGDDALRFGLAHKVVVYEEIDKTALQTAEEMAKLGLEAVVKTKKLINKLSENTFTVSNETQDYCASVIAKARTSHEGQERVKAFLNRNDSSKNE